MTERVARYVSSPTRIPLTGAASCKTRRGVDDVARNDAFSLRSARTERHESLAGVDGDADLQLELGSFRFSSSTAAHIARAALTARSGSSPWATGAPKTAITASPMNFSTVPPNDSISERTRAK